ncbi:uncharacterized protein LOC131936802 [Physella acuta]|uniref:uncharacterized protein LOC131936802 n=1 Tax=Physella acuta TaxID=109671 RepID=UPI0027DB8866|nr:uncharacterized protein LOC131936802 [Physella acuta]
MSSVGPQVAALALSSSMENGRTGSDVSDGMTADVRAARDVSQEPVLEENYRILKSRLLGLIDNFLNKYTSWITWMDAGLKAKIYKSASGSLNISQQEFPEFTTTQYSRLYRLTQLSAYAYYIKSQVSDPSYGAAACQDIQNITSNLQMTSSCLKQLVQPDVTNDAIYNFVTQHVTTPEIPIQNQRSAVKRAFTATVLTLMKDTMSSGSFS